jgi:hypothetical protein
MVIVVDILGSNVDCTPDGLRGLSMEAIRDVTVVMALAAQRCSSVITIFVDGIGKGSVWKGSVWKWTHWRPSAGTDKRRSSRSRICGGIQFRGGVGDGAT